MSEDDLIEDVEEVIEILPEDLDELDVPEEEPVLPAAEETASGF